MSRNYCANMCSMHLRLIVVVDVNEWVSVVDVNEWVSVVDEVLGFTDI